VAGEVRRTAQTLVGQLHHAGTQQFRTVTHTVCLGTKPLPFAAAAVGFQEHCLPEALDQQGFATHDPPSVGAAHTSDDACCWRVFLATLEPPMSPFLLFPPSLSFLSTFDRLCFVLRQNRPTFPLPSPHFYFAFLTTVAPLE
jgi:hypothetical protein